MTAPTVVAGFTTFYKDPDNKDYYWGDITQELTDRETTPLSVSEVVIGVTVVTATVLVVIAGRTWCKVLLTGLDVLNNPPVNQCTWRIVCADGQQFDRTIKFLREDH